jgi:hypothetical protein
LLGLLEAPATARTSCDKTPSMAAFVIMVASLSERTL